MTARPLSLLAVALLVTAACAAPGGRDHGHDHGAGGHDHGGHGHDHGGHGGGDHHGQEEGESVAVTRWTAGHELFVELDAPIAGATFEYHAHVTRLADNHAATSGALTFRFERDGFVVESHTDPKVARNGIFAAEAPAPGKPGAYHLVLAYADGDERAEWDAGTVQVGASEAVAHEGEDEGEITFLKEAQWQIPFGVEPAALRPLAPVVRATAVARPAPGSSAVVAAPTSGLLAWTGGLPVVGRRVDKGERLATLLPAGAAEHWTRLQADLATARIDRDLAGKELERVKDLAGRELLPGRRLAEARAALERADAEVQSAERRASALTSGSSQAVAIRAPATGWVVSVGAAHGEAVAAGAPLVTVSPSEAVLLEGRVHERGRASLTPVASLRAERGDWDGPRDLLAAGGRLLTERLVYDPATLSAPVSAVVEGDAGIAPGDVVELMIGVGEPTETLAVPIGAVVEIGAQPMIFVQKTGESFTRRRVTLGRSDGAHVAILAGVEPGDMVVTVGGFDVHVASLSGALESHRH